MLTIFSCPKAFQGHIATIQRNAIRSWLNLRPTPRIILLGGADGTAEVAKDLHIEHLAEVRTNEFGTPLLSDLFTRAEARANGPLCFANADIILTSRFAAALAAVSSWAAEFVLVSERIDLPITDELGFQTDWEANLEALVSRLGKRHSAGAIDVFAFTEKAFGKLPPFAIGRTGYDGWLLWKAASSGVPVIDGTAYFTLIHQNHDYSHAGSLIDVWEGPEAAENQRLMGHWSHFHTIKHARWRLDNSGTIVPARGFVYRLARPKRLLGRALRGARPLRNRFREWQLSR